MVIVVVLAILGLAWMFIQIAKNKNENDSVPPPVAEQATVVGTNRYNLMLGANPSISAGQKYLPPEDSVVVTNEAQVRALIERAHRRSTNDLR